MSSPLTRWSVFSAAPHRMMFLGGMVQITLPLIWWGTELAGRYLGLPAPAMGIAPSWAHAWLMLFTPFLFFFFGFLMTTYPRWMGGNAIPRRRYVPPFLLMAGGVVLGDAGLFLGSGVLVLGIALHLAGFFAGWLALLEVYRKAYGRADRYYETHLNIALLLGMAAEACYLGWLMWGDATLLMAALRGGFWLFLLPILFTVAHRMVPFFTSCMFDDYKVVQPRWSLPLMWSGAGSHFLLELAGLHQWLFIPDAALLVSALYLTLNWGFRRSFSQWLLASLHIAFAMLSVGLALLVIQGLWLFVSGEPILGRGPLHLIAIGFMGGMVIAMVTRVSRGHSGRPLVMDRLSLAAFFAVEAAALARTFGEAGWAVQLSAVNPNLLAAALWLAGFLPWALWYGSVYLRPRVDGKSG